MTEEEAERIVDAVCEDWTAVLAPAFRPDCCIAAASIGAEALSYFGVRASAVACDLTIFNPEGFRQFEAGAPISEWPPSAWSVGSHHEQADPLEPKRYNGHLVILLEDYDAVIDLAIGQFSRPEKGIAHDAPLILSGSIPDRSGRRTFPAQSDDGSVVIVWLRPEQKQWRSAPDYRTRSVLAGPMIRRLRHQFANQPKEQLT